MSPQADYVVSNGTGAAVRSDINGQLAAIVSNNSGASAPATTYAYQFWADTSTNLLKLRNGANSAFITIGDLTAANLGLATLASPTFTGTATIPTLTVSTAANIPLGSAASPTLYFTGDSNTGLYSPGADQVALSTGGTGRLFIDSSGRCGIGTSSPTQNLTVTDVVSVKSTPSGSSQVLFSDTDSDFAGRLFYNHTTDALQFFVNAAERARIDSSGRLGIGTTTPTVALDVSGGLILGKEILLQNAAASSPVLGTTPSWYSPASGTAALSTNASERLRIDSSGRLLVGTSTGSGNNLLHIAKSANSADVGLIVQNSGTSNNTASIYLNKGAGTEADYRIQNDAGGNLTFAYGTDESSFTERMRINNSGQIQINGAYSAGSNRISLGPTTSNFSRDTTSFASHIYFENPNGTVGQISTNGSATSFTTSSDYRLKENVAKVTDGITRLQQLKPSRFNFIADPGHTVDGFIAHEVQDVVPEAITGTKDEVDADGNPIYQGIDQSKLVPLLTAALQEAIAKIETLEAKVAALESA